MSNPDAPMSREDDPLETSPVTRALRRSRGRWRIFGFVVLAIAVFGVALQHVAARLAGVAGTAPPPWIDPAVESALLLGMLGTLSGMVNGFVGLSPEALEPGPLVHALGTALRSSFIGFAIALVGVWVRALPATERA